MINFYNNLEADGDEVDDATLEKIFFIKPTKDIQLRIQKSSSETGLNLNNQVISSEQEDKPRVPTIPRIPMEKLSQRVSSPKILNESPVPENEAEDYVTNPVMVGAMNQTSKFENKYEDDFDGCNITLDMQTSRLAQFPEEYEMLQHIEDPD